MIRSLCQQKEDEQHQQRRGRTKTRRRAPLYASSMSLAAAAGMSLFLGGGDGNGNGIIHFGILDSVVSAQSQQHGHGRNWTSIVDWSVIGWGDRRRYTTKFEIDPFVDFDSFTPKPTRPPVPPPTFVPTNKPTSEPIGLRPTQPRPTFRPTKLPTPRPTPEPVIIVKPTTQQSPPTYRPTPRPVVPNKPVTSTYAPTTAHAFKAGNGGCADGFYLFGVFKYDQGGDGWDSASISMYYEDVWTTKFAYKGTLANGSRGLDYVCLPMYKCITVFTKGGTWTREIKWEIKSAIVGVDGSFRWSVARGLAPEKCEFSFVPDYEEPVCANTCTNWVKENLQPIPAQRTLAPLLPPSKRPTVRPTARPTFRPTPRPTPRPASPTSYPTKSPSVNPTISDDGTTFGGGGRKARDRALVISNGGKRLEKKGRRGWMETKRYVEAVVPKNNDEVEVGDEEKEELDG